MVWYGMYKTETHNGRSICSISPNYFKSGIFSFPSPSKGKKKIRKYQKLKIEHVRF